MHRVSIVILNYNHPEIIDVCLRSLQITEGVAYEVIVVDNGSEPESVAALQKHWTEGRIDRLVLEPVNHYFSEGNNIGVRNIHDMAEYILLLNSDVGFLRPDWLVKQIAWMEGEIEATPTIWGLLPTHPEPGPYDIISIGWSHDANIEGHARPEGWCCLIRKEWWRDLSPDLPFHGGFEEAVASAGREGAKIGVLFNYAPYLVHKEGGSGKANVIENARAPEFEGWFRGVKIETLDFTLDCPDCPGPIEHLSYMEW